MFNQKGAIPVILLLGIIGIIAITIVANYAPFKDQFLTSLYPKDNSFAAGPAGPVKIMPIGDSVTHGIRDGYAGTSPQALTLAGYRYYLYKNLNAAGDTVDFVGPLQHGPGDLLDKDHAGFSGENTSVITENVRNSVLSNQPNFVLLMAGVNDFAQIQNSKEFKDETINRLSNLIDQILAASSNTKVIVSTLTPNSLSSPADMQQRVSTYNAAIPGMVNNKAEQGKQVYLINLYDYLTSADISDGVHPNESGYQKIADAWQNMLTPLLQATSPLGLIANYSYVKPGAIQTVSWFNLSDRSNVSWIGLYPANIPDSQASSFTTWFYIGACTQAAPQTSPKTGFCKVTVPTNLQPGKYEFRLYLHGTTLFQKSNQFDVTISGFPVITPSPSAQPTPAPSSGSKAVFGDFNGDRKADTALYRPSVAKWFISGSGFDINGYSFGSPGAIPVMGDYDGDGRMNKAYWRPDNGTWYVDNQSASTGWGQTGDIPIPSDYNGDGKTDKAVYRPSTFKWHILLPGFDPAGIGWGVSNAIPVPADYNGDGTSDIAVFNPANGAWLINIANYPTSGIILGQQGDIPVPADYNKDGKADLAVFRPSNGTWHIQGNPYSGTSWGQSGDIPVPADYDGDGDADIAIFRPSNNGLWAILNLGGNYTSNNWGQTGDTPAEKRPSILNYPY